MWITRSFPEGEVITQIYDLASLILLSKFRTLNLGNFIFVIFCYYHTKARFTSIAQNDQTKTGMAQKIKTKIWNATK